MSSQEEPEAREQLFTGLTRPRLLLGVPIQMLFVYGFIAALAAMYIDSLLGQFWVFLFIVLPSYGLARLATDYDVNWMNILQVKITKCQRSPNHKYWKANSFRP